MSMTNTVEQIGHDCRTYQQSDGYLSHYRLWGHPESEDVVVLLHGGISHSGWQAPLAQEVVSSSDISFIGLDRRGSGLSTESRGHLPSPEREIEDIISFLRSLKSSFRRVHLAGWCFGGQIASIVAAQVADQHVISSLVMVAPGFVFTERYADVLRLSMQAVSEVVAELGVKPDPDRAFVPVPLQTKDFTESPEWLQFVADDALRLTRVSPTTVAVWQELADTSRSGALSQLGSLPVLVVFGSKDRLVDNDGVTAMLHAQVQGPAPVIKVLDTHHAVQFEEPKQLAGFVTRFVSDNVK
jgi:pimeloyl-ACP methyl ester carboxylesterase